nr:RNA-directed DNA polymerase, eukaryota [Tanacetum cinerariifolium]
PNRLNPDQVAELENPITRDEIRNAVWTCGENKSPGPDGFTFEFFQLLMRGTGIKIDSSLTISHLFYADDAVFNGEWSNANVTELLMRGTGIKIDSSLTISHLFYADDA